MNISNRIHTHKPLETPARRKERLQLHEHTHNLLATSAGRVCSDANVERIVSHGARCVAIRRLCRVHVPHHNMVAAVVHHVARRLVPGETKGVERLDDERDVPGRPCIRLNQVCNSFESKQLTLTGIQREGESTAAVRLSTLRAATRSCQAHSASVASSSPARPKRRARRPIESRGGCTSGSRAGDPCNRDNGGAVCVDGVIYCAVRYGLT
jgi:hypothetical protein